MDRSILDIRAMEQIRKIKGINKENLEEALTILESIKSKIEIKELVKEYVPKKIFKSKDNQLKIENTYFTCEHFSKIEEDWMDRILFYMISISDIENITSSNMVTSFYIYLWKNIYLDTARSIIKEKAKPCLSFGPGYYGMNMEDMESFYTILEGSKIGVELKEGVIYPGETCTGMFIKIKEEYKDKIKDSNPCKDCKGNRTYCETCIMERENL